MDVGGAYALPDLTTFAYLLDFFVLPEYRGRGYGKALIHAAMSRLAEEGVRGVMLRTADAHGFYEKFGFQRIDNSSNVMRCALGSEKAE
jgi:GNAT superfamily N-acetyltransferase